MLFDYWILPTSLPFHVIWKCFGDVDIDLHGSILFCNQPDALLIGLVLYLYPNSIDLPPNTGSYARSCELRYNPILLSGFQNPCLDFLDLLDMFANPDNNT